MYYKRMKNNLLLIFLAFVLGYTVSGAMNHMWGDLYEGVATSYCQRGWHMIDEPTEITNKDIQNKIGEGSIMVVEREDYTQMYCEKCPAGKYNNKRGSKCFACPDDLPASVAGSTECSQCPTAKDSVDQKIWNQFMKNSDPPIPCPCADGWGQTSDGKGCQKCPQNHAGIGGVCKKCPDEQYAMPGSTKCKWCTGDDGSQNMWYCQKTLAEENYGGPHQSHAPGSR